MGVYGYQPLNMGGAAKEDAIAMSLPPGWDEHLTHDFRAAEGAEVSLRGSVVEYNADGTVLVQLHGAAGRVSVLPQALSSVATALQRSSVNGEELVRLAPSPGDSESSPCFDTAIWRSGRGYAVAARVMAYGVVATLTWALTLSSFVISVALLPVLVGFPLFRVSAVMWRWLAHRHLDLLLQCAPPRGGCVLAHPSAALPDGSASGYFCSTHTWGCLALLLLSLPLGLGAFVLVASSIAVSGALMIVGVGVPLMALSLNLAALFGSSLRRLGVCLVSHQSLEHADWPLHLAASPMPEAREKATWEGEDIEDIENGWWRKDDAHVEVDCSPDLSERCTSDFSERFTG